MHLTFSLTTREPFSCTKWKGSLSRSQREKSRMGLLKLQLSYTWDRCFSEEKGLAKNSTFHYSTITALGRGGQYSSRYFTCISCGNKREGKELWPKELPSAKPDKRKRPGGERISLHSGWREGPTSFSLEVSLFSKLTKFWGHKDSSCWRHFRFGWVLRRSLLVVQTVYYMAIYRAQIWSRNRRVVLLA